jgi:Hint domain-containing protein
MSKNIRRSGNHLPSAGPSRRHFMGIAAASVGRISIIAVSAAAAFKAKDANALGIFPRDLPGRKDDHHCFGRGTLIQTPDGETRVEDLTNGDLVMTTNGELPVKWVGRKTIRRNESVSWHPRVVPIRVSRFAIDDRTPHRDLYLSQEHSLLIDGVLIPVKYLVNGRSIVFDDAAQRSESIEYFCVELDTHEVIFAEGTAAESFRYTGGHQIAWDNLSAYQDLYGSEHEVMSAVAPICRYGSVCTEVGGLIRLAASRFVDVRDPIQIAYDRIAARAMAIAA